MPLLVLMVASTFGALVSLTTTASANHFSGATGATGCTGLNRADNANHGYYYYELQSETTAAMDWTRSNNMNPTNINTSRVGLSNTTDVVVLDRYYSDYCGVPWIQPGSGGVVGLVTCKSLVSGTAKCESHDLRMSNHFTDNTTRSNIRGLACHEDGHTVGLAHRSGTATCMPQGYPKPANAYDAHDRTAINSHY